jgi:hypothetical protein
MFGKGEEVRFIKGKYVGKNGWLNSGKKPTPCYYYVIVLLEAGKEVSTRVLKTSVSIIANEETPTNFEGALLQQHPDLETAMDKLCDELAKCGLSAASVEMPNIFMKKLSKAINAQNGLGNKAKWRHVYWREPAAQAAQAAQAQPEF